VPFDPEREHSAVSYRAKQLLVLATDAVLEALTPVPAAHPTAVAGALVDAGMLPACYRRRYDAHFLRWFHNTGELTRNSLVGDLPYLANTAQELAAAAIFAECRLTLEHPEPGRRELAAAIDGELPEQLEANAAHVAEELDALQASVFDDGSVFGLFDLPLDREPGTPGPAGAPEGQGLLRFEHWLVPFGNAPRPQITYDGRAWPSEL
jgi:hypothetical protein